MNSSTGSWVRNLSAAKLRHSPARTSDLGERRKHCPSPSATLVPRRGVAWHELHNRGKKALPTASSGMNFFCLSIFLAQISLRFRGSTESPMDYWRPPSARYYDSFNSPVSISTWSRPTLSSSEFQYDSKFFRKNWVDISFGLFASLPIDCRLARWRKIVMSSQENDGLQAMRIFARMNSLAVFYGVLTEFRWSKSPADHWRCDWTSERLITMLRKARDFPKHSERLTKILLKFTRQVEQNKKCLRNLAFLIWETGKKIP